MSDSEFGTGLRAHLAHRDDAPAEREAESSPDAEAHELQQRAHAVGVAEARLEQRERQLAAAQAAVAAHAQLLVEREAELERAAKQRGTDVPAPGDVRELLRRRAEECGDRLWETVERALAATRPDGGVDHATRLAALHLLITDAYSDSPVPAARVEDELARLRERRTAQYGY